MYLLKMFLAVLLLLAPWGLLHAQWPPDDVRSLLGLSASIEGGTEIRVWVDSSITINNLYRIRKVDGRVSVESLAWTPVPQQAGLYTTAEAKKDTKQVRKIMVKYHCADKLNESEKYLWCHEAVESTQPWDVLFDDLLPEELWHLQDSEHKCGFARMDGVMVGIEILDSQRRHAVVYGNPDFCCPTVSCAIADHVLRIVTHNIK